MFAKVTDCLQSGCVWPPSLKLGPEVSSYYTRVHTFDDLFHFVSFRSISFRSVPGFITSHRSGQVELAESETGTGTEAETGMDNQMGGAAALEPARASLIILAFLLWAVSLCSPHSSSSDPIIALEILMAVILACSSCPSKN